MEVGEQISRGKKFKALVRRLPNHTAKIVDRFFYTIGYRIALRPIRWLIASAAVVFICLSGLTFFRQEKDALRLWVPMDSRFVRDTEWLLSHFHEGLRIQTVILTADDVFQPEVLIKLNEITRRVIDTQSPAGISWSDVCYKIPAISGVQAPARRRRTSADEVRSLNERRKMKRKRGFFDDFFDLEITEHFNETVYEPSVHANSRLYCALVNSLKRVCLVQSVLDIFEYDEDMIRSLPHEELIEKVNTVKISPTLGHPIDYLGLIGNAVKDENGVIQSATAIRTLFTTHVNFSRIDSANFGNDAGTADWATEDVLQWEKSYLNTLKTIAKELEEERKAGNSTIRITFEAGRSFGDISSASIFQDVDKVIIGAGLMFLYVLAILSDSSWVGLRFYLTGAGLLCIAGAFIVAVGLCSILGIPYGPVHTSLPFMLLGLGVDDIFVMVASWKQVHAEKANRGIPLPERIGLMLGHAGSAICITSLTDVIAFVIGASTILPSLQSFCIYAAVGVLVTFLLQLTFFVGFFTLDCKRVAAKRNGVVPCVVHSEHSPHISPGAVPLSVRVIDTLYDKLVLTIPGRASILAVTLVVTGFGILGSLQLQQWFDPHWFLPTGSYLAEFRTTERQYFMNKGYNAFVLIGEVDYPSRLPRIITLAEQIGNMSAVQSVQPWPMHFNEFVNKYYQKDLSQTILSEEDFHLYLSKFLFSRAGGKYQGNFQFKGNLTCGKKTPKISLSTIDFMFKRFFGPHEWIPAMDDSLSIVDNAGIDGYATVWCKFFSLWVTDKLIAQEVLRNLLLALVCVIGMTSILIMELQTCFWILLCVLLTLLDVCGFMHFWGLTIDVVTCIGLELSIGLSVDYAAHMAHSFLVAEAPEGPQNRRQRVQIAVRHIGAAVAYGAGSTLVALSMLVFSEAYVFMTFFKIFFLVILFGLWHGLLLLPVVLSLLGPRSVKTTEKVHLRREQNCPEDGKPLKRLNHTPEDENEEEENRTGKGNEKQAAEKQSQQTAEEEVHLRSTEGEKL